ncbi:MAG: hypothetical protein P0Y53_03730 [Candidatus Pseudobacter hemicellulosilyticus]|uniref:Uncharacterized protein n=1 Tax=Candidatus Pseudobacter hemicellulosilyticus TaxID=3121375 RepID=A0AAJ5WT90_9BACT|nr:MAG: hypothetical protein P0Y53_03730 [Pseudobacter sp.]
MMQRTDIRQQRSLRRVKAFLSAGMMLLLLWLTSINFFIYASADNTHKVVSLQGQGEEESPETFPCNPSGPDEKSPGNPVSLTEEYIHDAAHAEHPSWIDALFQHMIHEAEQLSIVHFELLSPPPEA